MRDYFVSISKTNLMVGAAKIEANQVLGLPLTISTQKVELIIYKVMVSKEVLVLTKSRFEEGSQNPISLREVILEEHCLYLS